MIQKNIGEATKRMENQNNAIINHVIVERAHPEDAAELLEFTKTIGAQTDNLTYGAEGIRASVEQEADFLKGLYDSQKEIFLIAKADGKIVGTANFAASQKPRLSHRGEIGISVEKSMWGQGIATMLMQRLIDFAKNQAKVELISLEVRSDNAAAIHLYEKFGFQKYGTFPGFLKINGKWIDADCMVLSLH